MAKYGTADQHGEHIFTNVRTVCTTLYTKFPPGTAQVPPKSSDGHEELHRAASLCDRGCIVSVPSMSKSEVQVVLSARYGVDWIEISRGESTLSTSDGHRP